MSMLDPTTLTSLIAEHSALDATVNGLEAGPHQALALGQALLAFGAREHAAFASLLDASVRDELQAEHQQIGDDLELLDWLVRVSPDSPDVTILTASLVRRMRVHIDRDGRLLARAAMLQSRAG